MGRIIALLLVLVLVLGLGLGLGLGLVTGCDCRLSTYDDDDDDDCESEHELERSGIRAAVSYYDTHAAEFVARTVGLDVAHLRQRFTDKLPVGGRVLDAGCGSGRDSKAFVEAGFRVMAFDASAEMVRAAKDLTLLDVTECEFREFRSAEPFDGIWACASLLHVPRGELGQTLEHLIGLLRPGGVLYGSLKFGSEERMEGERYFNDVTPESFSELVTPLRGAVLEELWVTAGVQESGVRWVNALVRKN